MRTANRTTGVMVALASIFFFVADQAIRYLVTLLLGIH